MNDCKFLGRLTRDIELKYTPGGTAIAEFGLAVSRSYKDKSTGEYGVDFVECQVWAERGETVAKYFSKGDPILVHTEARLDSWEDKEGKKRSKISFNVNSFEFVPKNDGASRNSVSDAPPSSDAVVDVEENEEIPF